MRIFSVVLPIVGAIALAGGSWVALSQSDDTKDEPRDSDIVERSGIELQLLDVEVRDKKGRPIRGLKKEDFEIWIDARKGEVYSVDDLCGCPDPDDPAANTVAAVVPELPADVDPEASITILDTASAGPAREPVSYVLYFDFSQLQADGRVAAFDEAHRWIDETLPPTGKALIAGYHSVAGVVDLVPLTSDKGRMHRALDEAFDDPDLVDPFPSQFRHRVEMCPLCCRNTVCFVPCKYCCRTECMESARLEAEQGRRSYRALSSFLQTLEAVPGRKALLLFYQNLTTYPGRYWPVDDFDVQDHIAALDQVGADATMSRTNIYAAFVGNPLSPNNPAGQAVNVGANLADFTGGAYSRAPGVLQQLTEAAVRDCSCTYRIALVPRKGADNKVHRILVEAAGRTVPFRYRTQFIDETDRWWRDAQLALVNPGAVTDIAVRSALMPDARGPRGWSLSAQVALDPRSLMTFPRGGEIRGEWEVGALLNREDGKAWEMLAVSALSTRGILGPANVLHEHRFEDLPGGSYRLGAFVRDTAANAFGGADATLELTPPGRPGLVGPLGLEADRVVITSTLPLYLRKASKRAEVTESRNDRPRRGTIPLGDAPLTDSRRIIVRSWVCPGASGTPPRELVRWVSRDDDPLFRFEEAELHPAGDCLRIDDTIETAVLEPASYTYHLRVVQQPDSKPLTGLFEFTIALPEPATAPGDPSVGLPQEASPGS